MTAPNQGTDGAITNQPAPGEPYRRISILTEPSIDGGHDNPAFESPRRRISLNSEHTEMGPVRKKSILHNRDAGGGEIAPGTDTGPVRKKSILTNPGDGTLWKNCNGNFYKNKKLFALHWPIEKDAIRYVYWMFQ